MNKSISFAMCLLSVAVISNLCGAFPSSRQLLPAIPGFVPVYIQNGDTPLEEINLELAEAFHAIPSGRSAGRKDSIAAEPEQNDEPEAAPEVDSDHTDYIAAKEEDEKSVDPIAIPVETGEEPKAKQVETKPKEEVVDEVHYLPESVEKQ